jgi:probable F420-dependent oxidoreductase
MMQFAITLPQLGRASDAASVKGVARLAEDLGFSDIWVNDHIGFSGTEHPSPRMHEPLTTLAMAAAITSRIGLGSQITASYYPPVYLAKILSSLDSLSGGRLKVAIGVGWQRAEFAAMGSDFRTRGKRTDEIIALLRSCWESGTSEFESAHYRFPALKISPRPAHRIPIWIAGTTRPAFARAVALGDGYHGQPTRREGLAHDRQNSLSQLPEIIRGMREARPDRDGFCISMYTHEWDPSDTDLDTISRERDFFAKAGVQHVVAAIHQRDGDRWMRSVERLARIFDIS